MKKNRTKTFLVIAAAGLLFQLGGCLSFLAPGLQFGIGDTLGASLVADLDFVNFGGLLGGDG